MISAPALTTSASPPATPVPALAAIATFISPVAAAITVATIPAVTTPVAIAAAEVLAGRLALDDFHWHERQLAAVVDLADLDLQLVADLDHVIDVLDPYAAVQLADLGDVQQPVLAGQQRHEGAERGGLDHRPEEPLADLGNVRVGDRIDRRPGRLGRRAVGGADVDGAVILDGDLGARVLLDRVDHLALPPDDLADLVHRDLDGDDPRRVLAHVGWRADGLAHDVENGQPGVPGLLQRRCEHRRRAAAALGVELQGGDHVTGARDLEVHVAEGVLRAQDVGQGHVIAALVDEAHGDPGHHVLQRD